MALGLFYGDCRILPKANGGEKNLESGAKGEGRSGFRKQDIFFCPILYTILHPYPFHQFVLKILNGNEVGNTASRTT